MPKLTYANVVATLALFLALGGVGYAATRAPKNSVTSQAVKDNSLTSADLRNGKAVTSRDIVAGSIGTAQLSSPEAVHYVGAPGQPPLTNSFELNSGAPLGFYRGPDCVVHLVGAVIGPAATMIFRLPQGFRPENEVFAPIVFSLEGNVTGGGVEINPGNGTVVAQAKGATVHSYFALDSVTFRAAGCGASS